MSAQPMLVLGTFSFRPGQLEVLLPGKDVFARMATGAGKSLCFYLVPLSLSSSAVGVVVGPLMDQQVISIFMLH